MIVKIKPLARGLYWANFVMMLLATLETRLLGIQIFISSLTILVYQKYLSEKKRIKRKIKGGEND